MQHTIRKISSCEYPLLEEFLYLAIHQDGSAPPLPRDVIRTPAIWVYIDQFGSKAGDACLVAEADGKVVGAVWVRLIPGYGHLDDNTPEFAISVREEYRGQGIGTCLMKRMLELLRERGYERASLSVQRDNAAARLYKRLGFRVVTENAEDWILEYRFK